MVRAAEGRQGGGAAALARLVAAAVTMLVSAGCVLSSLPASVTPTRGRQFAVPITLHGTALTLHLSSPAQPAKGGALLLYASGDGGWFGTATRMFQLLAAEGYPAVGLSARAFMRIERPARARLDPHQLALDYREILARAREALGLAAATPAVLTGWSRGASFAVLAAAASVATDRVQGLVAIGLAEGEDFAVDGPDNARDDGGAAPGAVGPFLPYDVLTRGLSIRGAVIQATGDGYLPALAARRLLGPDSERSRLWTVVAKNHRFDGGAPAFAQALHDAVHWAADATPEEPPHE